MAESKTIKIHNKSDKPDNIVLRDNRVIEKCIQVENNLPKFMKDYCIYLKGSVSVTTRLAYLEDIQFFCSYLIETKEITIANEIKDITLNEFNQIKARDVNLFLGDYCTRYYKYTDKNTHIYENNNRALARKKSSLSTLFKFLFRNDQLEANITDGFNPIKLPKPQPDAIKRLEIDEVAKMLDAVDTGLGLTDKEKVYWKKTKLRDKAILALFVTYGLRLNELRELNISSFNFSRGEFKIYRKRGKEVLMPINNTCELVVRDYILNERPKSEMLSEDMQDALFLSLQNKRMDPKSIRQLVKKYTSISMDTSRDKGYSPHKLRATAATSLIQNGFSIYDVQNLLDHDNVTTTQLYAAHKKNVKRDIVNNFEWIDDLDDINE
ncbi:MULTISPECIES: tyrosine-type recombinase/integrase [Paraclostridium]|uniref:Recombinase n=4 Tax=Bacillota TaxID=1239 RepID=A0A1X2JKZ5_PARBF|nr:MULTISPECIES: tyrosine-type recombinase/integrase [Paraclostridium]KGJ49669.1 recombinase [Clostridium sp. NCR]MCU9809983.1 tyrosine-type recombinase/integrase [Paraclostridium sp. AKS46]MDV8116225.1 tyrosine-type recombinase/integrase [Bacillus sp. BAU-SS-2023]EQK41684.1 phage integrase family protein [[Clostridium] bifermentans ATCC 19299] [Paraclostridium bifermentans ATCC 19299]EQK42820.1 phage integrase family protein [[Clostridium] bifermentans ATCC 638] [Paraclostridium bifermentans 